jgi:hypothetical protein
MSSVLSYCYGIIHKIKVVDLKENENPKMFIIKYNSEAISSKYKLGFHYIFLLFKYLETRGPHWPRGPLGPLVSCGSIQAGLALKARQSEVPCLSFLALGTRGTTAPLDNVSARVSKVTLQSF